MATNDVWM